MRTIVYVDGFNLYYGACRAPGRKWLDPGALCARLLPNDEIVEIAYCTANGRKSATNPGKQERQRIYHRALETIPHLQIHRGRFLRKTGFKGRYDQAALISNDGDLAMPVEIVRTQLDLPVVVINPVLRRRGKRRNTTLSPLPLPSNASFLQLRAAHVEDCQLPCELRSPRGLRIVKPESW